MGEKRREGGGKGEEGAGWNGATVSGRGRGGGAA